MANPFDAYHSSPNPVEENQQWLGKMVAKYPLLAEALLGNEHQRGSGPVRPPLSFILSVKDGRLRFVLSSQASHRTYYGPIDDASEPLEAAERALLTSAGEWSTRRENGARR